MNDGIGDGIVFFYAQYFYIKQLLILSVWNPVGAPTNIAIRHDKPLYATRCKGFLLSITR